MLSLFDNFEQYDISNFIIHDGNRISFEFITSGSISNNNIYLLTGAKGSGKTYLCNIWKELKGANKISDYRMQNIENEKKYILEDIDKLNFDEELFLHLINDVIEKRAILLMTSIKYLTEFNFSLQDLQSRFKNIYNLVLGNIDLNSKKQILLKLLLDRGLNLNDEVIDYISINISDNYESLINFVNQLFSCEKITFANIKDLLK